MRRNKGGRLYSAYDLNRFLECRHCTCLDLLDLENPQERAAAVFHYNRQARRRFEEYVNGPPALSDPEPCYFCAQCDWRERCGAQWERDGHLSLVAGIFISPHIDDNLFEFAPESMRGGYAATSGILSHLSGFRFPPFAPAADSFTARSFLGVPVNGFKKSVKFVPKVGLRSGLDLNGFCFQRRSGVVAAGTFYRILCFVLRHALRTFSGPFRFCHGRLRWAMMPRRPEASLRRPSHDQNPTAGPSPVHGNQLK
jgi:hypothetical protein